jgi:serine/threonine-protein kinase
MPALSVIGSAIGGYRILGPLGVGGTGAVYVAEHPLLGRRVAVKILHPRRASDGDAVAGFFADCLRARELDHPSVAGIVELSEVSTAAGRLPCVIGELLEGVTLAELLAGGPLSPARAVAIAEQVAEALAAAHAAGLVHGALKPENVFIVGGVPGLDEVKLQDFGTWRFHPSRGGEDYQAPEQRLGARADEASDVYGLGALLEEMVAGAPVPPSVAAIIARALEPIPAERFASMTAMQAALSDPSSYAAPPVPAPVPVPVPAPAPAARRRDRRAVLAVATTLAAAIMAVVTLAAASRGPAPAPPPAVATISDDVRLVVSSCAPAARVYLDGRDAGAPGQPLTLRRGEPVEITVRAHGFYPFTTTVTPERDTRVEAVLLPRPAGPPLL